MRSDRMHTQSDDDQMNRLKFPWHVDFSISSIFQFWSAGMSEDFDLLDRISAGVSSKKKLQNATCCGQFSDGQRFVCPAHCSRELVGAVQHAVGGILSPVEQTRELSFCLDRLACAVDKASHLSL